MLPTNIKSFDYYLDIIKKRRDYIKYHVHAKCYTTFGVHNDIYLSTYTSEEEKINIEYLSYYTEREDITEEINIDRLQKYYYNCINYIKDYVIKQKLEDIEKEFN